jgi:hypothetical protein
LSDLVHKNLRGPVFYESDGIFPDQDRNIYMLSGICGFELFYPVIYRIGDTDVRAGPGTIAGLAAHQSRAAKDQKRQYKNERSAKVEFVFHVLSYL